LSKSIPNKFSILKILPKFSEKLKKTPLKKLSINSLL